MPSVLTHEPNAISHAELAQEEIESPMRIQNDLLT